VVSTGRRVVHGGDELLTIRLIDGTLTLTPAWMIRPEAAACTIRPGPRLCVAQKRSVRKVTPRRRFAGKHAERTSASDGGQINFGLFVLLLLGAIL
jgi:hypothetical protein